MKHFFVISYILYVQQLYILCNQYPCLKRSLVIKEIHKAHLFSIDFLDFYYLLIFMFENLIFLNIFENKVHLDFKNHEI